MRSPVQALVVVGASLAGLRAVETARREGHTGRVVLVGAEEHLPYDRPPLSKEHLAPGAETVPHLLDEQALAALDVDLRLGSPATGVDVAGRRLLLADDALPYDALVVATGAHARSLPASVPGHDLPHVRVLRTLDDARAVRAALDAGARTVVVGAGFIGSEVASAVRARDLPVTLVEAEAQPLVRALGEQVAALLSALHPRHGTDLRLATTVTAVREHAVQLSDGSEVAADLVVVGAGASPTTGWLEGSDLQLDDGVLCDATLQAAGGVWAAGDVARYRTPDGSTRRLEHWTAASEQGALAARNAVTGARQQYAPVPFVWTEWYGTKVHLLGDCRGEDVHVVGDPDGDRWLALYRQEGTLVGAVTVGLPGRTPKLRRRVGQPFEQALELVRT